MVLALLAIMKRFRQFSMKGISEIAHGPLSFS